MELKDMTLTDVNERLSVIDGEIESAADVESVNALAEEKRGLISRKAELEDLEERKKIAEAINNGEINGTITASSQPENCGITHPIENRRFTVREIARIQSFPDNFDFSKIPLQSRYKVIGNAVPPVLGWVVAKTLTEIIKEG